MTRAFVEQIMGMPISIHLRGPAVDQTPALQVVEQAFGELRRVDELFSTYRRDSQVAQIQRGQLSMKDAHPWVQEVARLCERAHEVTGGAFTTTLPQAKQGRAWDPTGLVKGWAVERAGMVLSTLARTAYCINAGGDILAGTHRAVPAVGEDRAVWRVGLEDPRDREHLIAVIPLSDGAVATSGTAARGAHLYDPFGGFMIHGAGSTTVVGPSLTWSDVWATALFVGGKRAMVAFDTWQDRPGYYCLSY